MGKPRTVLANGMAFKAQPGDVLLDAALLNGIEVPHDCRAGVCGTCSVTLLSGHALCPQGIGDRVVRASKARVLTDLTISFDEPAEITAITGDVAALEYLASDIIEVTIAPRAPFEPRPGQYAKLAFDDFPERCFSPTARLDGQAADGFLRFHIKRVRNGKVTSALGRDIVPGSTVRIEGPYGGGLLQAAA